MSTSLGHAHLVKQVDASIVDVRNRKPVKVPLNQLPDLSLQFDDLQLGRIKISQFHTPYAHHTT